MPGALQMWGARGGKGGVGVGGGGKPRSFAALRMTFFGGLGVELAGVNPPGSPFGKGGE